MAAWKTAAAAPGGADLASAAATGRRGTLSGGRAGSGGCSAAIGFPALSIGPAVLAGPGRAGLARQRGNICNE